MTTVTFANGTVVTFPDDFDGPQYLVAMPLLAAAMVNEADRVVAAASTAGLTTVSTSSVAIGAGTKNFTVETGKGFVSGVGIKIIDAANSANYMVGSVTSYNTGTGALVVDVEYVGGSGTKSSWNIIPFQSTADIVGVDTLTAGGSAGVDLRNSSGSSVILFGAGGGTGVTFSGGVNINAGTTHAKRPTTSLDAAQTFALDDQNCLQRLTGSTDRIWTIPANSAVAFATDTEIEIFNDGTGILTLTADTGVTINGVTAGSIPLTSNQGGVLKKVSTDRWIYMGDNKEAWA